MSEYSKPAKPSRSRRNRPMLMRILVLTTFAFAAFPVLAQDDLLPGGGTSLRETHGDWTVTCMVAAQANGDRSRQCSLSQEQLSQKTHQRALAVQLHLQKAGIQGRLVLPFGLSLARGVTYRLDGGRSSAVLSFRTCLPLGCIVDIGFDAAMVAALKKGTAFEISMTADSGQALTFSVPLKGFTSAYDRVDALMR